MWNIRNFIADLEKEVTKKDITITDLEASIDQLIDEKSELELKIEELENRLEEGA